MPTVEGLVANQLWMTDLGKARRHAPKVRISRLYQYDKDRHTRVWTDLFDVSLVRDGYYGNKRSLFRTRDPLEAINHYAVLVARAAMGDYGWLESFKEESPRHGHWQRRIARG